MMIKPFILISIVVLSACADQSENQEMTDVDDTIVKTDSTVVEKIEVKGGSETLYMYKWTLAELNGKPISNNDTSGTPRLGFFPGQINRVTGTTGCNTITGTFDISAGNMMKFKPLAVTKMACIGGNIETPFLEALAGIDQFSIGNKDSLLLLKAGQVVLKFSGKSGE